MWKRNHSLPEQIERGLAMNENLFRPQFDALKLSDKLWLMQTLATRYNLTFKELYAFSRWGQSCTTGLLKKVAGSLSLFGRYRDSWLGGLCPRDGQGQPRGTGGYVCGNRI